MYPGTAVVSMVQAAAHLLGGRVGVLPSDTVYGLAARAADPAAVARLYALKDRENKPGTVIAASVEQLAQLGIDATHLSKVTHFWPAPLSIVLPAGDNLAYIHQDKISIAMRIPADPLLRAFLEETGPLVTSSANHPGQQIAGTIDEAYSYFGDTVDFYVDGGDLSGLPPSTVARLHERGLELLRQGAYVIPPHAVFQP